MEGAPIAGRVQITIEDAQLCPRFTAGLVEGITIGPSPAWMQRRLIHAGMRPVNNIVDISNYVMLEWGEPTHAFDADRVQEQHLIARLAQPGERLTTLDGKERDLSLLAEPVLLVCDPSGPLALAGVMGGESSEVSDTTTRVLLEAAIWHPPKIRRTAQAFKLPSEASRRFERGVDWELPPHAQHRTLELMRTLAGGTVAQGIVDVYPQPWQSPVLDLPPAEVTRILGIHLEAAAIADLLRPLGFGCAVTAAGTVSITVPSFRQDVTVLADLCEEVARTYGYDKIPTTRMADELPHGDPHPDVALEQQIRDLMVAQGVDEVITYALTSMAAVARLTPTTAQPEHYLRLSNPISPEREYLRRSMLPTLLEALALNLRERERVLLFDIGRVFLPRQHRTAAATAASDTLPGDAARQWLPEESRSLGVAIAGPRTLQSWHTPVSSSATGQPMLDFFDLKGIIETLLERLGLSERVAFVPLTDDERFHPGRAARLLLTTVQQGNSADPGAALGVLGELHPLVCERLEVEAPRAAAAELELETLMALSLQQRVAYRSISRYPATIQDIAVVVAEETPSERVSHTIRHGAGDLLESLTLFDRYSGPQIGAERVSLAYRLVFRAPDRTLSDEAVAKVRTKIIKLLERELGATIRS
jgi:phenylalanyl-tRNA synthetase beta chain